MKYIADLHVHSKYSRACSKDLNIDTLEKWARVKGVDILGTGDFCHPEWIKELKEKLIGDGKGIFRTKTGFLFILQNEISLIYTQGKGRRVHLVLLAPDFETVDKITSYLKTKGRVDYDGRPIFKISCEEFTYEMKKISEDIEIIPAHAWTPYFGVFGSKTGFNSIKEAFGKETKHIYAIETGISSDPAMNHLVSSIDDYNLVSFSDLHSFWPWRIGREATVFDLEELTYDNIIKAIRTGEGLYETIEVDPNYGKYHLDGHAKCKVSFQPEETRKYNGICPVCKRPLTIGVLNRVEELSDRKEGKPKKAKPFRTLIPLHDIISLVTGKNVNTKSVWKIYNKILTIGKNEYDILLNKTQEELETVTTKEIAEIIMRNREGKIKVKGGYDGEYGVPQIEGKEDDIKEEHIELKEQKGLNDYF